VELKEDGWLPTWPDGPFIDLADFPDLGIRLGQVANLARDAKRFREGRGWTRAQVAARAGLNEATYGDFEAGRTRPVETTLYRVAAALEVDLHYVGRRTAGLRPPAR
jgi:DNA-binding XRE family transcriptional regulator